MVSSTNTGSWNNFYQPKRALLDLGVEDPNAFDNLPRFLISTDASRSDLNRQAVEAKDQLSDFNRQHGTRFSYVDNGVSNFETLILEVAEKSPGINLKETFQKLVDAKLIEKVLLPSRTNPNEMEKYLLVSENLFQSPVIKNNDVIKFFAKLSSYTNIDQFLLPGVSKNSSIKENGASRLFVYGGYKVLRFLDEKKYKFEISSYLDADHTEGDNLRRLANSTRIKLVESFNNGVPDGTSLSGAFPCLEEAPEYKAASEVVRGWLRDPINKNDLVYRSTGPRRHYTNLQYEDLQHKDPQKILDRYLDPTIPVEDLERIRSSNWFWVPEEKTLIHGPTDTNAKIRERIEQDLEIFLNLDCTGESTPDKKPEIIFRTFNEETDSHLLDERMLEGK